ncbi:unnamed protein product, partial [marine sediment metagenome]
TIEFPSGIFSIKIYRSPFTSARVPLFFILCPIPPLMFVSAFDTTRGAVSAFEMFGDLAASLAVI